MRYRGWGGGQIKDKKKRKCNNKKQVFVAVLRARSILKHVAPKESSKKKKRVLGAGILLSIKKRRDEGSLTFVCLFVFLRLFSFSKSLSQLRSLAAH